MPYLLISIVCNIIYVLVSYIQVYYGGAEQAERLQIYSLSLFES